MPRFLAFRPLPITLFVLVASAACGGRGGSSGGMNSSPVQPQPSVPQCDPTLWNHVYDPSRLQVINPCLTVSGVIAGQHKDGDGDVISELALDPGFATLINNVNMTHLKGHLQLEEVCQAPITRDAFQACSGYTGTVLVPPVGAHVSVTGSHVRDRNHGWMEIHPVSEIDVIP